MRLINALRDRAKHWRATELPALAIVVESCLSGGHPAGLRCRRGSSWVCHDSLLFVPEARDPE